MSKSKIYYWLKLKDDFFDDDTIAFIEEQENGIAYSNFYLKLCLKALKTEGRLIRLVGNTLMPYDIKSIARLTGVPADTVAVAMRLFEQIGLVERLETGEIYISQIDEMIGKETDKAALMRKKRAESKFLGNNVTPVLPDVTQTLPKCYTEIRDKSLEIREESLELSEREKEKEEKKREKPDAERPGTPVKYDQIQSLYNEICKSFPRCSVMSDARRKAIKARLASGYKLEDFKRLFEKAERSSFLKGHNNRNWMANFDWLIADKNMAKVLDGNYDDRSDTPQTDGQEQPNWADEISL